MSSDTFPYVPWQTNLLQKVGFPVTTETVMLDFGCGVGECVDQFRKADYQIFGCDIIFPDKPDSRLSSYLESGIIRKIASQPYKLPFEDNTFDLIFSNQVFEHVMDYSSVLAEIRRVLKPKGLSLHVFPGRWRVKEGHVYVPFASVIKAYWWLKVWALWGVRNEYQEGMSAGETAKMNWRYLTRETNYLSRGQIHKYVTQHFKECRFAEEAYFGISPRLGSYIKKFPFLLPLYRAYLSDTQMRVLVFGNKL